MSECTGISFLNAVSIASSFTPMPSSPSVSTPHRADACRRLSFSPFAASFARERSLLLSGGSSVGRRTPVDKPPAPAQHTLAPEAAHFVELGASVARAACFHTISRTAPKPTSGTRLVPMGLTLNQAVFRPRYRVCATVYADTTVDIALEPHRNCDGCQSDRRTNVGIRECCIYSL